MTTAFAPVQSKAFGTFIQPKNMANALVEYATFGTLMCANLGLGLYFSVHRRKTTVATTEEVFLGSRTLRTLPLAMSVLASMLSTIGVIGFSAHFYAFGFHYLWSFLSAPVVALVVTKVVIPVLYDLKVTSVFQVRSSRLDCPL